MWIYRIFVNISDTPEASFAVYINDSYNDVELFLEEVCGFIL